MGARASIAFAGSDGRARAEHRRGRGQRRRASAGRDARRGRRPPGDPGAGRTRWRAPLDTGCPNGADGRRPTAVPGLSVMRRGLASSAGRAIAHGPGARLSTGARIDGRRGDRCRSCGGLVIAGTPRTTTIPRPDDRDRRIHAHRPRRPMPVRVARSAGPPSPPRTPGPTPTAPPPEVSWQRASSRSRSPRPTRAGWTWAHATLRVGDGPDLAWSVSVARERPQRVVPVAGGGAQTGFLEIQEADAARQGRRGARTTGARRTSGDWQASQAVAGTSRRRRCSTCGTPSGSPSSARSQEGGRTLYRVPSWEGASTSLANLLKRAREAARGTRAFRRHRRRRCGGGRSGRGRLRVSDGGRAPAGEADGSDLTSGKSRGTSASSRPRTEIRWSTDARESDSISRSRRARVGSSRPACRDTTRIPMRNHDLAHSSRTWRGARSPQGKKRVRQSERRHAVHLPCGERAPRQVRDE